MTSSESQPRTAYPRTEIGESFLVNAEWHGPRCASNRTGMYRDCDCTLIREIVALEAEAAQDSRPVDVERLAKAMRLTGIAEQHDGTPWNDGTLRRAADYLAAEYARLAAEEPHD